MQLPFIKSINALAGGFAVCSFRDLCKKLGISGSDARTVTRLTAELTFAEPRLLLQRAFLAINEGLKIRNVHVQKVTELTRNDVEQLACHPIADYPIADLCLSCQTTACIILLEQQLRFKNRQ